MGSSSGEGREPSEVLREELRAKERLLEVARAERDDAEWLSRLTIEVLSPRHADRVLRSDDPHDELERWLYEHAARVLRPVCSPADGSELGVGLFRNMQGSGIYDLTHDAGVPEQVSRRLMTDTVEPPGSPDDDAFEAYVRRHHPGALTRRLPVDRDDYRLAVFVEPAGPEHPLQREVLHAIATTVGSWLMLIRQRR